MFAHIKRIDIQIFWMLNRNSFLGGRGGGLSEDKIFSQQTTICFEFSVNYVLENVYTCIKILKIL